VADRDPTSGGREPGPSAQVLGTSDPCLTSFLGLATSISGAWCARTAWIDDWDPDNPARGQCGTSSLALQDELGGTLSRGEIALGDGRRTTAVVHYWNVFVHGHVDLTWQQFPASARIVHRESIRRDELLVDRWTIDRYRTLRARLDGGSSAARCDPSGACASVGEPV